MDAGDIEGLLEQGTIERRPGARYLIQYRFYVYNHSMSVAADVLIINRLDPGTPFFAPASWQADEITYDAEKHTVRAVAPKLESMTGAMFEFYVEAP